MNKTIFESQDSISNKSSHIYKPKIFHYYIFALYPKKIVHKPIGTLKIALYSKEERYCLMEKLIHE